MEESSMEESLQGGIPPGRHSSMEDLLAFSQQHVFVPSSPEKRACARAQTRPKCACAHLRAPGWCAWSVVQVRTPPRGISVAALLCNK